MAVIIKGVNMPKTCAECRFFFCAPDDKDLHDQIVFMNERVKNDTGRAYDCPIREMPVGRWERNPYWREFDVCSVCHIGTKRREYGKNPDGEEYVEEFSYPFCPYCGAKMDLLTSETDIPF